MNLWQNFQLYSVATNRLRLFNSTAKALHTRGHRPNTAPIYKKTTRHLEISSQRAFSIGAMSQSFLLALRVFQIVLALIVLGTAGYVANWYNADTLTASPNQINFLVFIPIFSFITVAYLEITPRYAKRASHPYAHFGLEILNAIFYFSGFIALAVFLSKLLYCRGSVCASARTACIFAAINCITWILTTVLLGMEIFKGGFRVAQANLARQQAMMEKA